MFLCKLMFVSLGFQLFFCSTVLYFVFSLNKICYLLKQFTIQKKKKTIEHYILPIHYADELQFWDHQTCRQIVIHRKRCLFLSF